MKDLEIFEENRIKILKVLLDCREDVCGCDLTEELNISKNLLSYHIKMLREAGYLEEERCGRRKKYKVAEDRVGVVKEIISLVERL